MKKRLLVLVVSIGVLLSVGGPSMNPQAQGQYPVLDAVANKVIQKYQQSTCEQLWVKKSQKTPPTQKEQEVIQFLKNDPQMRTAFINKVAPPIVNKMFECGMIP